MSKPDDMKLIPSAPFDGNPDRIRCVMCGDTAGPVPRREMVVGQVCGVCLGDAAMDSAPYYADWQRAGERYYEARDRQRRKSQQATKRRVVRL
jgi:hypothetical protein